MILNIYFVKRVVFNIYKFIEDNLTIYFMHIFGTPQSHSYFLSLITRSKFILASGHFYRPFFVIFLITKIKRTITIIIIIVVAVVVIVVYLCLYF